MLTVGHTTNGFVQFGATVATANQYGLAYVLAKGLQNFFAEVLEVRDHLCIVRVGRIERVVYLASRCGCGTCEFSELKMFCKFRKSPLARMAVSI